METRENNTAVIYARVSSTGDRQSTERQVQDLNEYAKYRGLDLVRVFEEHISGAKRNEERPVLTDAVEFCLENKVGTLLVSEMSRLGRNAFEVLSTVKTLADNGVNLYLQKEQLSLLDDEGKTSLFFPIVIATLSTCAQLERENIQFRLSSAPSSRRKTKVEISLLLLFSDLSHHRTCRSAYGGSLYSVHLNIVVHQTWVACFAKV